MKKRETIQLQGLSCANCAAKIEQSIQEIDGISLASLDFAQSKITFEVNDNDDKAEIAERIKKIVTDTEPDISFVGDDQGRTFNPSFQLIRIGVAIGLSVLAVVVSVEFIKIALFLVAYGIVGGNILLKAINNIRRKEWFDENFLMSIATIGAFAIGEYPEAVAVMVFYQVGEYFQERAITHSRNSIQSLMQLQVDYAMVVVGDGFVRKSPDQVKVDDVLLVKAGDKIPVDGMVLEGESSLDTSSLTGESMPQDVEKDDFVYAGTLNLTGALKVKATKKYEDSSVSKMLELLQNAPSYKAKTEQFITKFAKVYTPMVVLMALMLVSIPTLFFSVDFSSSLYRALVFLVISCPCALVISIPLGFFGGIGAASSQGILIKGSNYLEALSNVETIVFDKTGTLTQGTFAILSVESIDPYSEADVLKIAAGVEQYSSHPIAKCIVSAANQQHLTQDITNVRELAGFGMEATYKGKSVLVGGYKLLQSKNIEINEPTHDKTSVYVVVEDRIVGTIHIADELKADTKQAIQALKEQGVNRLLMLSGDKQAIVDEMVTNTGLDQGYGDLLPHEKVEHIKRVIQQKTPKKNVVFVGDGINDAATLAHVDVGIAMGALGSDVAIEAADVVLALDQPSKIAQAISISKYTKKIVMQNIGLALGIKALFLLLGAFGLATLWEAVFADVGVTILAVLNAMRILKHK